MHTLMFLALSIGTASWWNSYGDPELNRIVDKGLQHNLDLKLAAQRIAEARAMAGQSKSKLGPSIDLTTSAQQLRGGFSQGIIRIPSNGPPAGSSFVSPFETGVLQGGLDMKWELDFFGTNRAALAASRADVAVEEEKLRDLQISVSAEVARNYLELRGFEERLAITQRNITAQRDLLLLTEVRADAGLASQVDVERQRVLLANTEATIPVLQADRELRLNRLAVLTGEERITLNPSSTMLEAPPTSREISSDLLKRRPDVRAAEAKLQGAMSRLKQARTDLYPKISINGLLGRQGTSFSSLSFGGGNFFNLGPQLQLPIFNTSRIKSNIAANDARVEQERIAWQREILIAFEEAANALSSLERQRDREAKFANATKAAQSALDLSIDLQKAGLNDFLSVLDAERSMLDVEYQRSAAKTQVLVESVMLYKALAGGWL